LKLFLGRLPTVETVDYFLSGLQPLNLGRHHAVPPIITIRAICGLLNGGFRSGFCVFVPWWWIGIFHSHYLTFRV
jgi:hypothetical protein